MQMAQLEEPSPFGSFNTAHVPDDAAGEDGGECVASVLESPFVSAQVDEEDFHLPGKKIADKELRVQDETNNYNQSQQHSTTSSTSGVNLSAVLRTSSQTSKGTASDMNNTPTSGVADMLESPFVSACFSQDLKGVEEALATTGAAADQLASATAAVNMGS